MLGSWDLYSQTYGRARYVYVECLRKVDQPEKQATIAREMVSGGQKKGAWGAEPVRAAACL